MALTETARGEQVQDHDADAVEIGNLYRRGRASMADSVRYLLEAGHRLVKKKEELEHGGWLSWLEVNATVLGFETRQTAHKLMQAATKCRAGATFDDNEALKVSRQIWGHNVRGTQGTGENEWFTPAEYIELARAVLGGIDLDPATHEGAQKVINAEVYLTKEDDGLAHDWHGRVWLNPPYAQPAIAQFVTKICHEWQAGHLTSAIMLTHNYTDTAWFHEAAGSADAICFTRGRVKFYEPDGGVAAPTQGQAFFYFGDDIAKFTRTFRSAGFVVRL